MSNVIDIITKLSYEADTGVIESLNQEFGTQIKQIGDATKRMQAYEAQLAKTAQSETRARELLTTLIDRQKKKIDEVTEAIGREFAANDKLQNQVQRQIGIIEGLQKEYSELSIKKEQATNVNDIAEFNRQLLKVATTLKDINSTGLTITPIDYGRTQEGLIGATQGRISALREQLPFANTEDDIRELNREIAILETRLRRLSTIGTIKPPLAPLRNDLKEIIRQAPVAQNRLQNLSFAGSQLLREAPAFTYSIQTGILALSNNIPILLDQLKAAKAEGASTTQIFKSLGSSVFGLTGLITIGVSLLTIFAGKLFESSKGADAAKKSIDDLSKSIIDQSKALNEARQLEANRQDNGVNAAKRRLDLLRAQGASETEILKAQQKYNAAQKNAVEQQIATLDVLGEKLQEVFIQQEDALLQGGTPGEGLDKQLRKNVVEPYAKVLQETLGITREQALEEAKAVADSYNTRDNVIKAYNIEKAILGEQAKDIENQNNVDVAGFEKIQLEKRKKNYEDFLKQKAALDELYRNARRINSPDIDDLERAQKELDDLDRQMKELTGSMKTTFDRQLQDDTFKTLSDSDAARLSASLAGSTPEAKAERKKAADEQKKQRQQAEEDAINSFQTIISIYNEMANAQLSILDAQLNAQMHRVEMAVELSKKGNATILADETARLDQLQAERERKAQEQIQLNAVLAASNQAVAVTEAIGAVVAAAAKGDPYTIALRIAAAVAALVGGIAAIKGAFKDGVVDFQGKGTARSDSNIVRISHGESVITADATKKYKADLIAMNAGTYRPFMVNMPERANSKSTQAQTDALLRELIEVNSREKVSVNTDINEKGVRQMVQKSIRWDKNRFK